MRHPLSPDVCFIDAADWRSQFQTAHLLYSTSGQGPWTPGNAAGENPWWRAGAGSPWLCSALSVWFWPALAALIYLFHHFLPCVTGQSWRGSLPPLPPAEFGLCEVWWPTGSYRVMPEETRYWLNFFAFFAFSKWDLTGLSLLPSRAATRLGFSVGWPSSCCGVCWSCIFQLTFYGSAQGGDKLMWTKCVVSTVIPAAPLRESR